MDSRRKETQMSVELELQKKEKHDGKLIGIIENCNNSHGNFILSVVMDRKLKDDEGVCFVSLLHPQSHYQYVGNKVGHNLKSSVEKQQVKFLDMVRATQESLTETNDLKLGNSLISWLAQLVDQSVKTLHVKYDRVCIIIDDISILLSLGCSVKKIQCFLMSLLAQISNRNQKSTMEKKSSLAVLTHVEKDDLESVQLAALIRHSSQFCANVTPLRITVSNKGPNN